MRIRRKIALIFTLLTSVVLLLAFTFVYYFSGKYAQSDFYDQLSEKATLTAWKYFEKDEMSDQSYQRILKKYLQKLPDVKEIVLNADDANVKDSLLKIVPLPLAKLILAGHTIRFQDHHELGAGLYYPDNQGNFIIIVKTTDRFGIQRQERLLTVLLAIFLLSVVSVFFVGQLYARRVLSPIVHILRNVRKINATNLSLRLPEKEGNDELTELTRLFNQMLERLDSSFTMQKNFISNASHELKNPLTAIMGETEVMLARKRSEKEYIEALHSIETEAERLNMLIRDLLYLAQTDSDISSMTQDEVGVESLLEEIKEYFAKTEYNDRLELIFRQPHHPERPTTILGNHRLLQIAITNLIDNACKFSEQKPVLVTMKSHNSEVYIEIRDQGIGLANEDIERLTQPFFRAANARTFKGHGIGYALAHRIIKLHGGQISFRSSLGSGTTVLLVFNQI